MAIVRSSRPVAAGRLEKLAVELLDASRLCAIATTSRRGRAHINTAYFGHTGAFDLVWISDRQSGHSRNLRASPAAAIAVYDSNQEWGRADRGIQLFGSARELRGAGARDAERIYAERFPVYEGTRGYAFYRFRARRLKLFDEAELGGGVFVTARVARGRLVWERTELYEGT